MHKILAVALAGLLLQTSHTFATEVTTLSPVVVTATRFAQPARQVPASTTIISAKEIATSGARDLGEVLRDATSIDVSSNGPVGSTSLAKIRGSSAEQVLVLLDGLRLNNQQNGTFDLSTLPISLKDIERIEIVRGPGSALYGSAASGGVIQIFSRKPETKPATTASWSEGSYDTRNFGLSQSWQIGPVYYRLGASADRSEGYRDNSELNQESYNGLVGLNLPGGYNLEVYGYYIDKKNGLPGRTSLPDPEAEQKDKNTFSQLKLSGPVGPVNITARVLYDRQKNDVFIPSYSDDDTHVLETFGSEIQAIWQKGTQTLVLGGDYYDDELDSTKNGKQDQYRWSLFSQYELRPTQWAKFLLGLRYDDHSDFRSVFSPRAGLILSATESTTVRLSAGKSFRAPTLNERFWPASSYAEGNPNLDPETAWEYEIGIDQLLGDRGTISVAGFMRQAKDLIQWTEVSPYFYTPENVNKSRTWGAEVNTEFFLHQQVTLEINYTYLRPKDRETGDFLLNIPHHQVGSFVTLGPFWDTTLRLGGRYARYYDDPNRNDKSYLVLDATLSRPFIINKNLEVELLVSARNILDRDYEINKGFPMPPAEIQVGITGYF